MSNDKNVNVQICHIPWKAYLLKGVVGLLVLLALFWGVKKLFCTLVPPLPKLDEPRREVAGQAVVRGVEALRAAAGNIHSVALLHLANDPTNEVTALLRQTLTAQGGLTLQTEPLGDRLRALCWMVNDGTASREDALEAVSGDETLDGVIWGKIDRLENLTAGAVCSGSLELYDLRGQRVAYAGELAASTVPPAAAQPAAAGPVYADESLLGGVSWVTRLLWFALVTLLLPVFSMAFLRMMVVKRSNRVNAFVLGFYTLIDALFALILLGGVLASGRAVMGFVVPAGVGCAYNVLLMNVALRLEEN